MAKSLQLFRWLIFFGVGVDYFLGSEVDSDPCLRGFTQTIPPVEEWDSYEVLDVNGGSFLYPELMFTCNGTLNSVTIPYSTIEGIPWDDKLSLSLGVWRRQSEGGYSQVEGDIKVPDVIISSNNSVATKNMKSNATLIRTIDIKTHDILQFIVTNYGGGGRREHIPYLLTDYQPPGYTKPVTVPLIHVDFSGQPEEGSSQAVGMITATSTVSTAGDICTQSNASPSPTTTESLSLGLSVGLAVVLTQIEATVLTVVVTVLVMYCCCKTVRVKKTRTLEVEQGDETGPDYEETEFVHNNEDDVKMQPCPAYRPIEGPVLEETIKCNNEDDVEMQHCQAYIPIEDMYI